MFAPRASPYYEVRPNKLGNWHTVDMGFFQTNMVTVLMVHFFALKAMLRSHLSIGLGGSWQVCSFRACLRSISPQK